MIPENPFAAFRSQCEQILREALEKQFSQAHIEDLCLEKPSNPEFGELASSLPFQLARQISKKPIEIAKQVVGDINKTGFSLIDYAAPAGGGYINFHIDLAKFAELTLKSIAENNESYGFIKVETPTKIIVEHTSVNPLHPMHIGTARNPIFGDALVRMLKARGQHVNTHYYVDDVGRQSSVIAYGYDKLGRPKPKGKPDQFIGNIYTVTSCIVEIKRLKRELERAKIVDAEEEIVKINNELDEWVAVAAELRDKCPQLFEKLLERIEQDENPEISISKLNQDYETGNEKAKKLVKKVSELCLEGFKETLARIGVSYDSWDWESELMWSGRVQEVYQTLKKSRYTFTENRVLEFDAQKVVEQLGLRDKLKLRKDQEIPSLTLVREDGTTLYTTRDIAYTLWKFERANKVINVIGMEQSLAQLQLKIALYALGFTCFAENLIHFAYNLVTMPGHKMSGRRGHFISFDEVMDEAVGRAFEEVSKRSPELSDDEKSHIANFVGIGAVRYALVQVDPAKPVLFTWDRVLNFERNSAPYIQYTHARACSIMRKAGRKAEKPKFSLLKDKLEKELILTLADFPDVFTEATDFLKPSSIGDYANNLADRFNTFYNALPVIKAEPIELSDARLALTEAIRIGLRNSLNLIGIVAPEKM